VANVFPFTIFYFPISKWQKPESEDGGLLLFISPTPSACPAH